MDVTFSQCMETGVDAVPYLGFGLYEHAISQYFCSFACPASGCKLMGFTWDGGLQRASYDRDKRLSSASITIAAEAAQRYADVLHCDVGRLRDAIGGLIMSEGMPDLLLALRGINIAFPMASVADAYYRAKVAECFALLMSGTSEKDEATDVVRVNDRNCVECICSYIENNLSADLSSKTLCDLAHINEGKLISAFRNIKGKTPQNYIRERRLEHGRILLLESDCGINEIAMIVGYRNQGAFSDAFKRAYGIPPYAYRKRSIMRLRIG